MTTDMLERAKAGLVSARVTRLGSEVRVELMGATRGERMVFAHALLARFHQDACTSAVTTRVYPDARIVTIDTAIGGGTLMVQEAQATVIMCHVNEILPEVA